MAYQLDPLAEQSGYKIVFDGKPIEECSDFLSPFKIGTSISLEQSVRADLSWNLFQKRIA